MKRSSSDTFNIMPKNLGKIVPLVSHRAIQLYLHIADYVDGYTGWTYKPLSNKFLSGLLGGISRQSLYRYKRELMDCELLMVKRVNRSSNVYGLSFDIDTAASQLQRRQRAEAKEKAARKVRRKQAVASDVVSINEYRQFRGSS